MSDVTYPKRLYHEPFGLIVEFTSINEGTVISFASGGFKVGKTRTWPSCTHTSIWSPIPSKKSILHSKVKNYGRV